MYQVLEAIVHRERVHAGEYCVLLLADFSAKKYHDYRELEAFSKFSSDLDPITAMALDKGRKNNILLKQPQYQPLPVGEQVALLYCGTKGLLKDLNLDQVEDFQTAFLLKMRAFHASDVLEPLAKGKTDPEIFTVIEKECASIVNGLTL
jgi:F-type H+-transporting ATPase subunit alpha